MPTDKLNDQDQKENALPKTRTELKAETRQKLIQAALSALSDGRSFDSLSLREVARSAGIAPTSFYRHFHDMDDLGLALISEGGDTLRELMIEVRTQASAETPLIRASVETLFTYLRQNPGLFRLILQESFSSHAVFRKAAKRLMTRLSRDLADYLSNEAKLREVPLGEPEIAADAMVSILFTEGIAMLTQAHRPAKRRQEAAITQLKLIMLGAETLGRRGE